MFKIGERVVYGSHGVCTVIEFEERTIDRKKAVYMVLQPLEQGSARFYIPTHNAAALAKVKPLLMPQELEALISSDAVLSDFWIESENLRKQTYRELISSCDRVKLMQMVHSVYRYKSAHTGEGKRSHLCDENFLRDAEKILINEIYVVLDVPVEEAREYLHAKLK